MNLSTSVCEPSQPPLCTEVADFLHLFCFPSRYFYINTSIPRSRPNFCSRGNFVIYKFLKIPIGKELLTFSQEYLRSGHLPSDNWSAHVYFNKTAKEKL